MKLLKILIIDNCYLHVIISEPIPLYSDKLQNSFQITIFWAYWMANYFCWSLWLLMSWDCILIYLSNRHIRNTIWISCVLPRVSSSYDVLDTCAVSCNGWPWSYLVLGFSVINSQYLRYDRKKISYKNVSSPCGMNLVSSPSVSTKYRLSRSASTAWQIQVDNSYMIWPLLVVPMMWVIISSSISCLSAFTENWGATYDSVWYILVNTFHVSKVFFPLVGFAFLFNFLAFLWVHFSIVSTLVFSRT